MIDIVDGLWFYEHVLAQFASATASVCERIERGDLYG